MTTNRGININKILIFLLFFAAYHFFSFKPEVSIYPILEKNVVGFV